MFNTYNGVVAACWTLGPLLAQSGVNRRRHQSPLLGAKRASTFHNIRIANHRSESKTDSSYSWSAPEARCLASK